MRFDLEKGKCEQLPRYQAALSLGIWVDRPRDIQPFGTPFSYSAARSLSNLIESPLCCILQGMQRPIISQPKHIYQFSDQLPMWTADLDDSWGDTVSCRPNKLKAHAKYYRTYLEEPINDTHEHGGRP
jgi:hypothetical protein